MKRLLLLGLLIMGFSSCSDDDNEICHKDAWVYVKGGPGDLYKASYPYNCKSGEPIKDANPQVEFDHWVD